MMQLREMPPERKFKLPVTTGYRRGIASSGSRAGDRAVMRSLTSGIFQMWIGCLDPEFERRGDLEAIHATKE